MLSQRGTAGRYGGTLSTRYLHEYLNKCCKVSTERGRTQLRPKQQALNVTVTNTINGQIS